MYTCIYKYIYIYIIYIHRCTLDRDRALDDALFVLSKNVQYILCKDEFIAMRPNDHNEKTSNSHLIIFFWK